MNAAGRLGAYATGLAVIFAASFAAAGAVVPEETVADWTQQAQEAVKNHPADPGLGFGANAGDASTVQTLQARVGLAF